MKKTVLNKIELTIKFGIERFIHCINLDPTSNLFGVADREFWAWKTKDFANGTLQAGISGLLDGKHLIDLNNNQIKNLIKAIIIGTKNIQRKNGSFEESFPYESSYCVTGLVLYNILYSYFNYKPFFEKIPIDYLNQIVSKSFLFLSRNIETHGVISNHLVTVMLAKLLAAKYLNIKLPINEKADVFKLLDKNEGWFPEYDGADPGYQTLLNHYLITSRTIIKDKDIKNVYLKSVNFTKNFCFPDGSYLGEAGSRGTAIVYPSGTLLSEMCDWFISYHFKNLSCITPINSDMGNFVPILNSWSFFLKKIKKSYKNYKYKPKRIIYPNAGLYLFSSLQSMMVISTKNSVIRKINMKNGKWVDDNLISLKKEPFITNGIPFQNFQINKKNIIITFNKRNLFYWNNSMIKSIILKLVSFLIFKSPYLQRLLKKKLKYLIMDNKKHYKTKIHVTIKLDDSNFPLKINAPKNWKKLQYGYSNHMASSNHFDKRAL